jgi:6-phosphofructokinase 1
LSKGYVVIVVAEGAEFGMIDESEKFTKQVNKDGSGNIKLDDIGKTLQGLIKENLQTQFSLDINVRYVDPTYAIRSVAANAADTIRCSKLAENAVHGAFYGYTAFSTGIVRNAVSWIPIKTINQAGIRKVNVFDRRW